MAGLAICARTAATSEQAHSPPCRGVLGHLGVGRRSRSVKREAAQQGLQQIDQPLWGLSSRFGHRHDRRHRWRLFRSIYQPNRTPSGGPAVAKYASPCFVDVKTLPNFRSILSRVMPQPSSIRHRSPMLIPSSTHSALMASKFSQKCIAPWQRSRCALTSKAGWRSSTSLAASKRPRTVAKIAAVMRGFRLRFGEPVRRLGFRLKITEPGDPRPAGVSALRSKIALHVGEGARA